MLQMWYFYWHHCCKESVSDMAAIQSKKQLRESQFDLETPISARWQDKEKHPPLIG